MTALKLSIPSPNFWHATLARCRCALQRAWTQRRRRTRIVLNRDELSDDRLRDLGLLDGRGPSLRRPERAQAGFP
jgi:uncharacterized protein YjiS (DUF1127 family)